MKRFREKFRSVDFEPKNDPFAPFWVFQEFSVKIQNSNIYPLLNTCHKV